MASSECSNSAKKRRDGGLGGAQAVELVLRLELGDHLPGADAIADIDGSLDHPSADPEGQTRLVIRLDASGIGDGFTDIALHDRHCPHRTSLWRRGLGFGAACRQHRCHSSQGQQRKAPQTFGYCIDRGLCIHEIPR
jgi:hypothetical protein